jgi:hypothetical protein
MDHTGQILAIFLGRGSLLFVLKQKKIEVKRVFCIPVSFRIRCSVVRWCVDGAGSWLYRFPRPETFHEILEQKTYPLLDAD